MFEEFFTDIGSFRSVSRVFKDSSRNVQGCLKKISGFKGGRFKKFLECYNGALFRNFDVVCQSS